MPVYQKNVLINIQKKITISTHSEKNPDGNFLWIFDVIYLFISDLLNVSRKKSSMHCIPSWFSIDINRMRYLFTSRKSNIHFIGKCVKWIINHDVVYGVFCLNLKVKFMNPIKYKLYSEMAKRFQSQCGTQFWLHFCFLLRFWC